MLFSINLMCIFKCREEARQKLPVEEILEKGYSLCSFDGFRKRTISSKSNWTIVAMPSTALRMLVR